MPLSTTSTKSTIGLFSNSARSTEGSRAVKRRLTYETLELIRQRGDARATVNYHVTSQLAKRCREAMREYLKERRAAVLAEAAEEARENIRSAPPIATARCREVNMIQHDAGSEYPKINGSQRVNTNGEYVARGSSKQD
ncbi:hypothetical protein ANCDUO_06104 [Ancylostoma duodenale]|uniref:Uncharacterized protein n=1 Tax=Ancylostoma duodenale TaxID=51022 RepID=A0A0C2D2J9_9BILA|nr:hypothetical protein ANCDUO_06104 [Ancylostoma duodenale]